MHKWLIGEKVAENLRSVSIGELVVSNSPDDILIAYGLGSCVAVCVYDPVARVSGMIHSLLPTMPQGELLNGTPAKYVDQGIPLLVNQVISLGAQRSRLLVHLCGGAQMLTAPGFNRALNIGERNVIAAQAGLQAAGLRIRGQATGGNSGRTVKLHVVNGQITVKTLGQGEKPLN